MTEAKVMWSTSPQGRDIDAPATMPGPGVGAEEPVVGQERWQELHRLKAEGMTVSGIARSTGLDRKTMRRCLRQARWQAYVRPGPRGGLLDEHRGWLAPIGNVPPAEFEASYDHSTSQLPMAT